MKIYSPNKAYTGVSAGVSFVNGVGETDKPELIRWFKDKGYSVEEDPVAIIDHDDVPNDSVQHDEDQYHEKEPEEKPKKKSKKDDKKEE